MHKEPPTGAWKHPARDGYMGEEHDDLYLEMLRADQTSHEGDNVNRSPKRKVRRMKIMGKILTSPYTRFRSGVRAVLRRFGIHPHP